MVNAFTINTDLKNRDFGDDVEYISTISITENINVKVTGAEVKKLVKLYDPEFENKSLFEQNSMVERVITYHLTEKVEAILSGINFEKIVKELL